MSPRWPRLGTTRTATVRKGGLWLVLGLLLMGLSAAEAVAQRPFLMSDPFYRSETARRVFFDNFALSGELLYQAAGSFPDEGLPTANSDLGFRFRFDYELATRFDIGAIFESIGGSGGRTLSLSWLVLKYYRYLDEADYAFRLAVDPSSDGRAGFPQVDVAFLYTSLLSAQLSSDFALGVRRVNIGYAQFLPPEPLSEEGPFVIRQPPPSLIFTRSLGTELHLMINYSLLFDPAGSNLFVGVLGEGGQYDVIESTIDEPAAGRRDLASIGSAQTLGTEQVDTEKKTLYRGGALWLRSGVELKRPSYRISPFVSVPLQQWNPESNNDQWPVARLHFGVMLMLR